MLTFELVQTDKHSIKILLRRKNLRFLRRTNLIKTRWQILVDCAFLKKYFKGCCSYLDLSSKPQTET